MKYVLIIGLIFASFTQGLTGATWRQFARFASITIGDETIHAALWVVGIVAIILASFLTAFALLMSLFDAPANSLRQRFAMWAIGRLGK